MSVTFTRDGTVGVIMIDNPPVNAASHAVRAGLMAALAEANEDAQVQAIVLACAGRTFVAGADVREFGQPPREPLLTEVVNAIEASHKPVVAAVHGTALGGGFELALGAHARIAYTDAQFGLPEVKLGIIPGAGGTQRLPRLVGASRALELMFTAEPLGAVRAAEIGLVNEVVPAERLEARVAELAALVASRSPHAVRAIKRLVHAGTALPLAEGLAMERAGLPEVFASADYAEGLTAFAEKRPPRFG